MNKILALSFVTLFLCTPTAWAAPNSGNELLKNCNAALNVTENKRYTEVPSTVLADAFTCIGYFNAITSLNAYYEYTPGKSERMLYCAPSTATIRQTIMVVVKFLKEHPEQLHRPDMILMIEALNQAFPCNESK